MLRKSTYIQSKNKRKPLLYAAFNCFTAALFLFLIIWGQSAALAHTPKYKNVVQLTANILSGDNTISSTPIPFHLPTEPATLIEESEVNDSDETQQDSNHDINNILFTPSVKIGIAALSEKNQLPLSTLAVHKRSAVSLFILYHSWKSFLI